MKVAVVGAGWAGLAAAVHALRAGHQVTLFEASAHVGGRARTLPLGDGGAPKLDNGQHILIGAYTETLRLMRQVGINPDAVLHDLPLALRFADGSGLTFPDWPSPLDALAGMLG
ncbi:MAG: desaturase, partial [Comamonadaceae bacterium CG17_big_fil_post_rev_8_21_14_2_50_60_13]